MSASTLPTSPRNVPATSLTSFSSISEPMFGWLDHDAEHRRYNAAKAERQNQIELAKRNLRLAMVELEAACRDDVPPLLDDNQSCTSSEFQMLLRELDIKIPVGIQLRIRWCKVKKNVKEILNMQ